LIARSIILNQSSVGMRRATNSYTTSITPEKMDKQNKLLHVCGDNTTQAKNTTDLTPLFEISAAERVERH
jgi:hypothetical protein